MTVEYAILIEFVPESERNKIILWDNTFISNGSIVSIFRTLTTSKRIVIPISEYNLKFRQKVREEKLDSLLK